MPPRIKIFLLLFFLYLLHYLRGPFLAEIDFFLVGLLISAYFLDYRLLFLTSFLILISNYFFTKNFSFFGLAYLILPLLAKRVSSIFGLGFLKFIFLLFAVLLIYVFISLIFLDVFGFKNFTYILSKNLVVLVLLATIFRYAFILKKA